MADEASTMLNLRIDASSYKTMRGLAHGLGSTVTAVVRPFIMWAGLPAKDRILWLEAVGKLRELVAEHELGDPVFLKELSDQKYYEHEALCSDLRQLGFIDDFKSMASSRPGFRLCTYKLTETGRIVASVFQEAVENEPEIAPEEMRLRYSEDVGRAS